MATDPQYNLPAGREFAFTILDDTDDSRVENARPIYDLLYELGLRTTKTLWPVGAPEGSRDYFAGSTLEDASYREFCLELKDRGFELTWHCATMESSERERVERGLAVFEETFGFAPRIHTNHGQNRENIYWGGARYRMWPLRMLGKMRHRSSGFEGEIPDSRFFWGDICRNVFPYTRNFTFYDLNTARCDPHSPYRLDGTPWVNLWFSTSDAPDANAFGRIVTPAAVDRLHEQRGVCILSTHLGKGFVENGRVRDDVAETLRYIASLPGWFVPVGELLDYRQAGRSAPVLRGMQLAALEVAHFMDRMRGPR